MPDPHSIERDKLLNDLSSSLSPATASGIELPPAPPVIPDHELIRCIGRGSYGEVWLARSVMGPWRAVKLVYRRSFDHDRPFERELEGIRRFEPVSRTHPSQLHILHVGRNDAAGCFYYVMELADAAGVWRDERPTFARSFGVASRESEVDPKVDGQAASGNPALQEDASNPAVSSHPAPRSLIPENYLPRTLRHDLLHRGRLPFDECLQIGLALATALDHLHRHGLVHRDVKPSNIIFVEGIPKLADIGLVAAAEATLSMVGTEGYLPPEGPGTPQADVYSLGKVLYEMATGRDRQDYPELPTNLVEHPPAELERITELNEIILRACHPESKQRHQSAADLHADLALLQSGKSVSRMRSTERRLRFVVRAGAVVSAVAVVAALAFLVEQRRSVEARRMANENRLLAEEQARLAGRLARVDQENRQRIVRLDIANGIRLLDEGDPSGALLWFADALPLLTGQADEASIHRIRIQQTLDQTPRILQVFPHDAGLVSGAFSPDGGFVATGTWDGNVRLWNAADGALVWGPAAVGVGAHLLRFSRDGARILASSSWEQGLFNGEVIRPHGFAVLNARSGRTLFAGDTIAPDTATEWICSHFSPDDRWLAISDVNHVIRVFDLRDGRKVSEIRGHTDQVRFLSFSADGNLLASASLDRTVRVWRIPSGDPAGRPLEHRWPVVRALLTDDGQYLVTASFAKPGAAGLGEDGESEVQAWEVPSGKRLGAAIPTAGWIALCLAPGTDGRFLVDGVKVDGAKGVQAYQLGPSPKPVFSQDIGALEAWHFSPDGQWVALAGGDYIARVFEANTRVPVTPPLRHGHWGVPSVQFSPDGRRLLTASSDGNARIWDLRPTSPPFSSLTLPAATKLVLTKNTSRQLGRTVAGTPIDLVDGTVRILDPELREVDCFAPEDSATELRGATSAWQSSLWAVGSYPLGANEPTAIVLLQREGDFVRRSTLEHPGPIFQFAFTRDDRYLLTYGSDRRIRFWRTRDSGLERAVEVPPATSGDVRDLSPDGRTAVWLEWTTQDASVQRPFHTRFLDLESGAVIGKPVLFPAFGAVFSPDASRLALLNGLGPVWIIETRTGQIISKRIAHSSNLRWVQWAPDGRRLLTSGHDDQVLIWDAWTGTQLHSSLRTQGGAVHFARWSPDGKFIVARNEDHQVRVWDADLGEAITAPLPQPGPVPWAFMTPTHRILLSILPDQLRLLDLKESPLSGDILVDYAKLLAGRRLGPSGALITVPPAELAALARSLQQSAPQLFE